MKQLGMPKIGTAEPSTELTIRRAELEAKHETMLSLPAWAASRIGWLGTVTISGTTSYYLTSGLPKLTESERSHVNHQIACCEALLVPAKFDDEIKLALVAKMIMALASAQVSETGAEARGEAYLFALGEVPAWAVDQAIKNWYTGSVEGIPEGDFKWAPSPAVLLRASRDVLEYYENTAEKLKRLRDAKPLAEIMDER